MSVAKTTCPDVSELSQILGPIDEDDSKKTIRPLCENIFDVQRSELFEVLERLRDTFWNDNLSISQQPEVTIPNSSLPALAPVPVPMPAPTPVPINTKRAREPDEEQADKQEETAISKKRVRMDMPQVEEENDTKPIQNTPPSPGSVNAYTSLWTIKKSLIRQIKNSSYKESDVIAALTQMHQTKSNDQCRHMSLYLMPFAKTMRRKNIADLLQKWV